MGCNNSLASTYKWTDDQGVTHYSDQVPPEQSGHRRSVLSPQAQEVDIVESPKSPEELKREKQLNYFRQRQDKIFAEQKKQDLALLRTYRNTDEMYLALRSKLEALEGIVKITETNINRQRNTLATQELKLANIEKHLGDSATNKQQGVIEATRRQIATYEQRAGVIRAEQKRITDEFNRDIERFKVIKAQLESSQTESRGNSNNATNTINTVPQEIIVSAIACAVGPVCNKSWDLARDFVLMNKTGNLVIDTDKIISTSPPKGEKDFGMTVTRIPNKNEEILFLDITCRPSSVGQKLCNSPKINQLRTDFKVYIEKYIGVLTR